MEHVKMLTREEMKQIKGGSTGSCTVTCCNCNNDLCQESFSGCDCDTYVLQVCGPGYWDENGPCATCTCSGCGPQEN